MALRMRAATAALALAALAGSASASVNLSEIFVNPPGTDGGQEFFELSGTPSFSLNNHWLLVIEGDGTGSGVIDQAISLAGLSLGTNGLFLWRDAASTIDTSGAPGIQGPSAGTNVNVADFNPDIENGSNTYLLVTGFTGAVGNDLDTNNDGVLDVATPWGSFVDGVSIVENDGASNFGFAAALGGVNVGPFAGVNGFNPDLVALGFDNVWYGGDVLGTNPGGFYNFDPARNSGAFTDSVGATPGVLNNIPSPGAMALLGMGGLLAARRRR